MGRPTVIRLYGVNVQSVRLLESGPIHVELYRGRLFLSMMARPKSSKACLIGSISREQVGHGNRAKLFYCSSHMLANIVVLQQNALFISSSLVWKAVVFQNVQLHEGVDVSIRSHQYRYSSFVNTGPYHH